jgi:hypothetical protein
MGLITGDILGLRAGLTRVLFDMLPRFLFARLLRSAFLAPELNDALDGELRLDMVGVILGCIVAEAGPEPEGVLNGPSFGVFLAENRGVPSRLDSASSTSAAADSGSTRSSSMFSCRLADSKDASRA